MKLFFLMSFLFVFACLLGCFIIFDFLFPSPSQEVAIVWKISNHKFPKYEKVRVVACASSFFPPPLNIQPMFLFNREW